MLIAIYLTNNCGRKKCVIMLFFQKVKCVIEGMQPLTVTLTGTCISVPSTKDAYNFSAVVRQKESKNLQLVNHTNQAWNLRPIIDGEFWSGPETIQVPPQTTKIYELTYHPLVMTTEGKKHTVCINYLVCMLWNCNLNAF